MEIRKPEYYDKFVCIADKCSMTCCREWKIGVDDETNQKWKALEPPKEVRPTRKNLSQYTGKKDGSRVIALNKKHLCPFLDEHKLCRLVCTYGDDVLSETCRIFPREIHEFSDRKELFLMPSCPAVIDLMRKYPECHYIETNYTKYTETNSNLEENDILQKARSIFSDWMRRREYEPQENLKHIFFAALELERILLENQGNLTATDKTSEVSDTQEATAKVSKSLEEYKSTTLQKQLADAIRQIPSDVESSFFEQNELLLDLTANYEKEGLYQAELEQVLCQARAIEDAIEELGENEPFPFSKQKKEFDQDFSRWQELMRSFLVAEIESDCVLPDSNMQDFLVHLEWIAFEYAAIKHFLFLDWLENSTLTYERVRATIVLICRMTGYEEADIYEYLEDSFEDVVWEWGYLAMILA